MKELKDKLTKEVVDKPVEVTDESLSGLVTSNPLVVVDCWAPWCGPCRMIAPVIEELARDYAGKVVFSKLNVDENRVTASQYHIMGIPALLIFKDGRLVDRAVGALPRQAIEAKLRQYLN